MLRPALLSCVIAGLMVSCAHRGDYTEPVVLSAAPTAFIEPSANPGPVAHSWVDAFGDETLRALVEEAWQANPNLIATAARLEQAKARGRQSFSRIFPDLNGNAGAGRSMATGPEGDRVYANNYDLGLSVNWEVDIWGRLAAAARSDDQLIQAATADVVAAYQSLAANVARAWFRIAHDQLQLELSENFRNSAKVTAELLAKRFADGRSPAVDVRAARAQYSRAEVDVAGRQRALQSAKRDLEVLLGRYPGAEVEGAQDLPPVPESVKAGLPASLLARRPDLQASAARLRSADDRLASAKADLLPKLALTAGGGYRSNDLKDIIKPENLVWNLAGNITQPLFDGGRRFATIDERQARVEELAANYAQAALVAFREVESALAIGEILTSELDHQRSAAEESRQVVVELRSRYGQGLTDGVLLLSEERQSLNRDKELLALRLQSLQNRIDLYLALGGSATVDQGERLEDRGVPAVATNQE